MTVYGTQRSVHITKWITQLQIHVLKLQFQQSYDYKINFNFGFIWLQKSEKVNLSAYVMNVLW